MELMEIKCYFISCYGRLSQGAERILIKKMIGVKAPRIKLEKTTELSIMLFKKLFIW
jgi:hypothetical protein